MVKVSLLPDTEYVPDIGVLAFHNPVKALPVKVIYAFVLKRYVPESAVWE